jgi:hypothetical protein
MKTKELLLVVLVLFEFQIFYGQDMTNKKVFGRYPSKHIQNTPTQQATNRYCNTTDSFNCRYIPTGLAWDGQNFWLVDTADIYKVSPAGVYLDSIPNPATIITFLPGGDLTYDGTSLWYADEQSATLFKINPTTGNNVQFPLPSYGYADPSGFSIAWDGSFLWHCNYESRLLYKLNAADGSVAGVVQMDREILTLEFIKGTLYGMGENVYYKINTNTGIAEDSVNWCVPFSLGLAWDGSAYWNVSGVPEIFGFPTGGKNKVFKMNADVNLSINKMMNKQQVLLFPNPASTTISIKGNNINQIEIYDVTGSLVHSQTNHKRASSVEIQVSTFPTGIYLTKIYTETSVETKRMIVQ